MKNNEKEKKQKIIIEVKYEIENMKSDTERQIKNMNEKLTLKIKE